MLTRRWLLAIPLAILTTAGAAHASEVRDGAKLFSPETVRAAEARLSRIEQSTGAPTIIETVKSLDGQPVERVAVQHAEASGLHRGVYVLIAKDETKIKALDKLNLGAERRRQIERAFTAEFRNRDFDAGLKQGTQTIGDVLAAAKASAPAAARRAPGRAPGRPAVIPPAPGGGGGGWGILLIIGLVIVAVLIGIRLLGSLFSGTGRGYAGGPMRGPGVGPAPPGYGGPGYGGGYGGGGGRGGFLSSLFGGLGGAMAGNWLYDQMSHRHHDQPIQSGDPTAGSYGVDPVAPEPAEWGGANEPGTDWGGGDTGGGTDWGGGDVASGGDWGGGGGGGDWGGGGGGGDDWS